MVVSLFFPSCGIDAAMYFKTNHYVLDNSKDSRDLFGKKSDLDRELYLNRRKKHEAMK
jgi:hypothetical protein